MRDSAAFFMVEALIAVGIGLAILSLVHGVATSASRVMVRGQGRLDDAGGSELVFRRLRSDLRAAVAAPQVAADGSSLEVVRLPGRERVRWTFGAAIVRTAGDAACQIFCAGLLERVALEPGADAAHPALTVRLLMRGVHDAGSVSFHETIFMQYRALDPDWNPIDPREE